MSTLWWQLGPCCSLIFLISVVLPWTPEPPLPCLTHLMPVCISGPGRVGVTALLIAPRGDLLGGWRSLASHTANPQQHSDVSQPVTKREYLKVWNTCIVRVSHTPLFQVNVSDILVFPCYMSVMAQNFFTQEGFCDITRFHCMIIESKKKLW